MCSDEDMFTHAMMAASANEAIVLALAIAAENDEKVDHRTLPLTRKNESGWAS